MNLDEFVFEVRYALSVLGLDKTLLPGRADLHVFYARRYSLEHTINWYKCRCQKGRCLVKILVCGSRTFTDYKYFKEWMDHLTRKLDKSKLVIMNGAAKGADEMAGKWCHANNVTEERYHPDYDKYGKRAPLERNKEMVEQADFVIAYWDGESRGTAHTINEAELREIPTKVIEV